MVKRKYSLVTDTVICYGSNMEHWPSVWTQTKDGEQINLFVDGTSKGEVLTIYQHVNGNIIALASITREHDTVLKVYWLNNDLELQAHQLMGNIPCKDVTAINYSLGGKVTTTVHGPGSKVNTVVIDILKYFVRAL